MSWKEENQWGGGGVDKKHRDNVQSVYDTQYVVLRYLNFNLGHPI